MKLFAHIKSQAAVLVCFALALPDPAQAAPQYHFVDLQADEVIALNNAGQVIGVDIGHPNFFLWQAGTKTYPVPASLGLPYCGTYAIQPRGINDLGQVVGSMSNCAVLVEGSRVTNLGSLGTLQSGWGKAAATAINNHGQIVGISDYYTTDYRHDYGARAFLWQDGHMTNLGALSDAPMGATMYAYSSASAINEAGQVLGVSREDSWELKPVLWTGGTIKKLDMYKAYAMNNNGWVVGQSAYDDDRGWRAVLYNGSHVIDLGVLGPDPNAFAANKAVAINDAGQVVGSTHIYNDVGEFRGIRAFLWENGEMLALGHLGRDKDGNAWSWALDINEASEVVGYSRVFDEKGNELGERAFYWAEGNHYNLNRLTDKPAGILLERATSINDNGWILGYGTDQSGARLNYLLIPVPEPHRYLMLLVGLLLVGLAAKRKQS